MTQPREPFLSCAEAIVNESLRTRGNSEALTNVCKSWLEWGLERTAPAWPPCPRWPPAVSLSSPLCSHTSSLPASRAGEVQTGLASGKHSREVLSEVWARPQAWPSGQCRIPRKFALAGGQCLSASTSWTAGSSLPCVPPRPPAEPRAAPRTCVLCPGHSSVWADFVFASLFCGKGCLVIFFLHFTGLIRFS